MATLMSTLQEHPEDLGSRHKEIKFYGMVPERVCFLHYCSRTSRLVPDTEKGARKCFLSEYLMNEYVQ